MYENFWSFEPTHTLWLQTNYLPEISGVDDGIWRRVKVMPWLSQFKGAQDDTRLGEKLWEELPGILNWIIAGVVAWQADGLAAPRAVLEATERYRNAEDVIGRFAKDIEMVVGADADGCFTAAKEIGKQFETWAEEEGIRSPPGAKARGEWLHAHGAERVKSRATPTAHGKQVWAWKNVEIKASLPDSTNTMSFDGKPRDVRDATAVHPREKGLLGQVQGGGVSGVSAAVKQDETDPPEHVLVGNIEPPQSADTPARWIDSSGTKRVGSERLAQHNDDNAEEATT
jgi:phage/plasmid-associated DNA primase